MSPTVDPWLGGEISLFSLNVLDRNLCLKISNKFLCSSREEQLERNWFLIAVIFVAAGALEMIMAQF